MKADMQDFSFTQDMEAADAVRDRKDVLPRAVVRSTFYQLLDGAWRFAHDPGDEGLAGQWSEGYAYRHTVQWPGSIEKHLAAVREVRQNLPGTEWQDKVVVWYECDFAQPSGLNFARECLQLTFGACGYETRV